MSADTIKNLSLWGKAYKTDPEYTKNYKGAGGFQGTAIASLYPVQRATEIFGPLGDGWDFEIIKDEFIPGGPLIDKETGAVLCMEQTHSVVIEMWANYDGKKLKSRGYGLTPHITSNKYGISTDHEAQKKSLTDAIKGALKLWGFSADVYMGGHDDAAYVEHLRNASALEKADNKADEELKQKQEYDDWKAKNLDMLTTAVNINMLEQLYKSAVRKAKLRHDDEFVAELGLAGKKRKEELTAKEEAA